MRPKQKYKARSSETDLLGVLWGLECRAPELVQCRTHNRTLTTVARAMLHQGLPNRCLKGQGRMAALCINALCLRRLHTQVLLPWKAVACVDPCNATFTELNR